MNSNMDNCETSLGQAQNEDCEVLISTLLPSENSVSELGEATLIMQESLSSWKN